MLWRCCWAWSALSRKGGSAENMFTGMLRARKGSRPACSNVGHVGVQVHCWGVPRLKWTVCLGYNVKGELDILIT